MDLLINQILALIVTTAFVFIIKLFFRPIRSVFIYKYMKGLRKIAAGTIISAWVCSLLYRGDFGRNLSDMKFIKYPTDGLAVFVVFVTIMVWGVKLIGVIFKWESKSGISDREETLVVRKQDMQLTFDISRIRDIGINQTANKPVALWKDKDSIKYLVFEGVPVGDGDLICRARKNLNSPNVYHVVDALTTTRRDKKLILEGIAYTYMAVCFVAGLLLTNYKVYYLATVQGQFLSDKDFAVALCGLPMALFLFTFIADKGGIARDSFTKFFRFLCRVLSVLIGIELVLLPMLYSLEEIFEVRTAAGALIYLPFG